MNPYLKAWDLLKGQGYDPADVLDHCAVNGFVHITPEWAIFASFEDQEREELLIWLATGKNCLQRFCDLAPLGLKRVSFVRGLKGKKTPKVYDFKRLRKLCTSSNSSSGGNLLPR